MRSLPKQDLRTYKSTERTTDVWCITYQVMAEYDFDENKVNTDLCGSASRAS